MMRGQLGTLPGTTGDKCMSPTGDTGDKPSRRVVPVPGTGLVPGAEMKTEPAHGHSEAPEVTEAQSSYERACPWLTAEGTG
jgi:hypothetical protein